MRNERWYEYKPSCSSQSTCNFTQSNTISCSHQLTNSHCPCAKSTATTKSFMWKPWGTNHATTDSAKSLLFKKIAWWTLIHTIRLTTSERNSVPYYQAAQANLHVTSTNRTRSLVHTSSLTLTALAPNRQARQSTWCANHEPPTTRPQTLQNPCSSEK